MLRTSYERIPRMFLGGLLWALSACTFPTIDYVEANEAASATCVTSPPCASDVQQCSKHANSQRNACVSQCDKSGPAGSGFSKDCSMCDDSHNAALNLCVAQCEACNAADGCTNATASCRSLLGLP